MKKLFIKKGINISHAKDMFNYLHNHYRYDTMNSWNCLKSIANKVKIYDLGLDGDHWQALDTLEEDEYLVVNYMIRCWENKHPNHQVGFNGRSGGYLVLYNRNNNGNILPNEIADYEYDEFKEYCRYYYGSVKNYMSELRYYTKLVRDFDQLCEELREYVNELSLR